MAVHSIVLETPLGELAEGTVLQVEEEVATSLISAGVAREATAEDVSGGGGEEEAPAEEVTEGEGAPEMCAAPVPAAVQRAATSVATKAAEKAVEKHAARIKRPTLHAPQGRHVVGSDEARTGGFK